MFLLIDPSVKDQISLAFFDSNAAQKKIYHVMNREVLACIDDFLSEVKKLPKDIQGIMVVLGEGGFSSTRIAVTVANTFAYAFQIPLLGITKEQAENPQAAIGLLLQQVPGNYLLPEYSGEPNIG